MTDWSSYTQYFCSHCHEECINHADSLPAQRHRCKSCILLELDNTPETGDALTTSEGTGELVRPEAQRSEHPGTVGERQSPSAPARPTGSAPSRGDPEARAFPPNPEGEGNPNSDTLASRRTDARSDGPK